MANRYADPDWDDFTWESCIVCGEPATSQAYTRLKDFSGGIRIDAPLRLTWVRTGWCSRPQCLEDKAGEQALIPRADAGQVAHGLAAAVLAAELAEHRKVTR